MNTTAKMKAKRLEMEKNPRIEYGNVEVEAGEAKVRISMWIDGDVLLAIRARADQEHTKYQTWINQQLRALVLGAGQARLDAIERRLRELEKRRA